MTSKLLSLCIPTYNREFELKRLLDTIVTQKGFTDEVEIIIADGPSKDGTKALVEHYQKQYKNIRYYRNEKNVGMTAAFLEVIGYSKSKYTWLIGSDDQLSPFSLESLLPVLKKESPKLIFSNFFFYKEDFELRGLKAINKYHTFEGVEEFVNYLGSIQNERIRFEHYFSFISVFCFDTDFYNESLSLVIADRGEKYINSHYFNFAVIVYYSLNKGKILLFDDYFLLLKTSNLCMWKIKWKIYADMKDLEKTIRKHYKSLSKKGVSFVAGLKRPLLNGVIASWVGGQEFTRFIDKVGLSNNWLYLFFRKITINLIRYISKLLS